MNRRILNKIFFLFALFAGLVFVSSCNSQKEEVSGLTPKAPKQPALPPSTEAPSYVFAGSFRVVNSGVYETLMRTCARCGTKRLIETPFGTRYERYWSLGESLKECRNWLSEGFLQLEFTEQKLPTSVKVLIQPKYRGSSDVWGYAFEFTGTAVSINQNKGFEIVISPNQGLGGVHNIVLSSSSSNHVEYSDLSLNVMYGASGQIFADPTLKKYVSRWVEEPQFTCGQYTN